MPGNHTPEAVPDLEKLRVASAASFSALAHPYAVGHFGMFSRVADLSEGCLLDASFSGGAEVITWAGNRLTGNKYAYRAAIGLTDVFIEGAADLSVLDSAGPRGDLLFFFHAKDRPNIFRYMDLFEVTDVAVMSGMDKITLKPNPERSRSGGIVINGLVRTIKGYQQKLTNRKV